MSTTAFDPTLDKHIPGHATQDGGVHTSAAQRGFFSRHKKAVLTGSIILTICAAATLTALLVTKPWNNTPHAQASEATSPPPSSSSAPASDSSTRAVQDSPPKFSQDPSDPTVLEISPTVRCNSYTPPLTEPFLYGQQPIRGVNLGGWLVLEPFITPSLFEPYADQGVTDEYSLTKLLGREKATELLRHHYATWVTEDTFKRIRDLGLNHVRIPIGFWALGHLTPDEPYVPDLALDFLLQGLKWAAKYGLRAMVEIHGAPGSQNGWNHSGRAGAIHWMDGTPEGTKNGQRTIAYIKQLAKLLNGPGFHHVAPMFGILNEPAIFMLERKPIDHWYKQAFTALRNQTGGAGHGPWAVIHDGFLGLSQWEGFMPHSDRLALDVHQYLIFDHYLIRLSRQKQAVFPCDIWARDVKQSSEAFGPTLVGEFSSATNDCAKWLNGIGIGTRWEGTFENADEESGGYEDEGLGSKGDDASNKSKDKGGSDKDKNKGKPKKNKEKRAILAVPKDPACQPEKNGGIKSDYCSCAKQNDAKSFTPEYRKFLSDFTQSQMDAFEQGFGWFYWNFKTETNALWSYFDGVDEGWIPKDINNRPGGCKALGRTLGKTGS